MKLMSISSNMTLSELSAKVGSRNLDNILAANSLQRTPNVGKSFQSLANSIASDETINVDNQRKISILNTMTSDSDIFESVALLSHESWRVVSQLGTIPRYLKIPETVSVPDSINILGNNQPVSQSVYNKVISQIQATGRLDPSIITEYSVRQTSQIIDTVSATSPLQWFKLPWGKITIYSSLSNEYRDFPVYPEELDDAYVANYEQMPETLYQYEPWMLYKSSGPRSNTYEFKMHRDMWTGDHRDGKCNELVRFCEANCYPDFDGASIQVPLVTLYIGGKAHITGVLTNVSVHWGGPIGLDDFYLQCDLQLTITEVSNTPLSHSKFLKKGLIG